MELLCSVNPARGFGPAVVSHTFHEYWIFWVGPLTGGAVAALVYQTVFRVRVSNLHCFGKVVSHQATDCIVGDA